MTSIFELEDYRKIIRNWVASQPGKGRGELLKMAEFLGLPASVFSQTLSAQRDLSPDHAYLLAEYMGFLALERDYFVTLVQIEKAHHHKFKSYLNEKKKNLKEDSLNLAKRVSHEKILDEKDQQEFYSSWIYSAIRLSCSLGKGLNAEQIKHRFRLSQERLLAVLEFLVRTGLIVHEGNFYKMGPQRTYVARNSPMVARHHSNWRIKALEKSSQLSEKELMFTGPVTCSRKDFERIREKMTVLIQEVSDLVKNSDAEELAYFGLDLLKIGED